MPEQVKEAYRLSPEQRRLWLLQRTGPVFLAQSAIRFEAPVQWDVLREAALDLVGQSEVLRTAFATPTGMKVPYQVLGQAEQRLDWGVLDGASPDTAWNDSLRWNVHFDEGPYCRIRVIPDTDGSGLAILTVPALCADTQTLGLIIRHWLDLYTARLSGTPATGEETRYVQFSEWRNEMIESPEDASAAEFWKRREGSAAPVPQLPFAYSTGRASGEFAAFECAIPELPGRQAYLAAWCTLIYRLSGFEDFAVGVIAPGRKFEELETAKGLFAQTLPLDVRIGASTRVRDVQSAIESRTASLEEFQEYRPLDDDTLLPVQFEWLDRTTHAALSVPSARIERLTAQTDRFHLKLRVDRLPDGHRAIFEFDTGVFDAADVSALASQFSEVIRAVSGSPDALVDDLKFLPSRQRERIFVEFNPPLADFGPAQPFHHGFEARAQAAPDVPAVIHEGQTLTAGDLNARANGIAHRLRTLGVGPDVPVVIWLDRGPEIVAALLGILKAGGAYVPLDASTPADRVAFVIEETRCPVIVTQTSLGATLVSSVTRLYLDAEWNTLRDPVNPAPVATAEHLAYVLFTSGSTGKPKGVAVEHRQLWNYVQAVRVRLALPDGAHYALISTFAADLGNTVLFPALLSGCLHVISHDRATSPQLFAEYAARHRIDCLKIVPSHLASMMTAADPAAVLPKQCLVCGGEALRWDLVDRIRELAPGLRLLNHYGPTETTVGVATLDVPAWTRDPRAATVPIGRPLANTRIYILDRNQEPSPVFAAGEVFIGGANVTRGYLGRPELTAERYLRDPFSTSDTDRVYRTGDRARFLADGVIEFLGRADDQVKIRGFRIEPGEVAAALRELAAVRDVTVLGREDTPGDVRLVAYIVRSADAGVDAGELRAFLKTRLPEAMIPAAFVFLNAIPLTANGKVDRRALPPPAPASEGPAEGQSPRTATEELLASIWCDLLRIEHAGIHENFIDLGGHSLLATQVVARIREAFAIEMPLRTLFDHPTIAGIAARIEEIRQQSAGLTIPPLEPASRTGRLPLSFAQQRLWILDQLEPNSSAYNRPMALQLDGPLNLAALEAALSEIVRRHESLRTRFPYVEGTAAQVIEPPGPVTIAIIDAGGEEDARRLASQEAQQPFSLASGPVFRALLIRIGPERHVFCFNVHHIVWDAWSMAIFTAEITTLYDAFSAGKPSPLADPGLQYADFAVWQRNWLQGRALEEQLGYWRSQLSGNLPQTVIPYMKPADGSTGLAALESFRITGDTAKALKALARREGVTPYMICLACLQALLGRYSGSNDVIVGTDLASRTRSETERMVGFFINLLVLRTNLGGDPTFRDLLRRVREVALGAFAHQDLPFEMLVDELRPDRARGGTPLFDVLFVYQNVPRKNLELSGLRWSPVRLENRASKFDLTLFMGESEDGFSGIWRYNEARFEPGGAARIRDQFERLIAAVGADPDIRIRDIELLSEADKAREIYEKQQRHDAKVKGLRSAKREIISRPDGGTS